MPELSHRTLLIGVAALASVGLVAMALLWPRGQVVEPQEVEGQTTQLVDATLTAVTPVTDVEPVGLLPGAVEVDVTVIREDTGESVTFQTSDETGSTYEPGQKVRLAVVGGPGEPPTYFISDFRRGGALAVLVAIFLVAVIGFGRGHGVRSLLGLGLTFVLITRFIVPAILDGRPPVLVALTGSVLIMIVTLYLSHGASRKTTAAVVGTGLALVITGLLAVAFVSAAHLTGFTSEEARLANYSVGGLSLRGLLLAGILIGGLGVLDDVTMAQASTVFELRRANPRATFAEVVAGALAVGRDHIAATVNTLFLAYAGASLPLLILFATGVDGLGVILTSEVVAVELVRTLVGSIGLIAAVPLTTTLAAALALPAHDAVGGGHDHTHGPMPRLGHADPAPAPTPAGASPESTDETPERATPTGDAESEAQWEAQLRAAYGLPERRDPADRPAPPAPPESPKPSLNRDDPHPRG